MSAADMSARALGENNRLTRPEVARQIEQNRQDMKSWLAETVKVGSRARLTTPKGAVDAAEQIRAVVEVDGTNINRELIDRYGQYQVSPSCRNQKARARGRQELAGHLPGTPGWMGLFRTPYGGSEFVQQTAGE
jgi:hypothetical protein